MEGLIQPTLAFIAAHAAWAGPVMFLTAFGESFAFISLAFPGTSLLIAAGTLMATGALPRGPVLAGAIAGAVLGDTVSYWLGRRLGGGIARLWPFRRNPALLSRGVRFFARHGGKGVFIGRFFGPIRAVIPLAAGILHMRHGWFWVTNIASAVVWAPMLLFIGDAVGQAGERLLGPENTIAAVFLGLTLFSIAGLAWAGLRSARGKT